MHIAENLSASGDRLGFSDSKQAPFATIYNDVQIQFDENKNHRKFSKLWSRVAPSGSIYRYLAFTQERMKHCFDLDRQLVLVAEEYKELLGGEAVDSERRRQKLLDALNEANPATGTEQAPKGFLPLQEFLDQDVTCTAGIFHPVNPDERSQWFFNHFFAFIILIVQIFGPVLLIMELWGGKANPLNNPVKLWRDLTIEQTLCLGKDRTAIFTTIIGSLFVIVVNMMIYGHIKDEYDDAKKMARLPADPIWTILGNIAQIVSSCAIIIAAPVELWTETGVMGIMMNSMALLFVYSLDDLAGDVFAYVGDDDSQFQKKVSWNYALLAYCPNDIHDLINPEAKSVDEFWKISYNAEGSLLSHSLKVCKTRIMISDAKETSPLVKTTTKCHFENVSVVYSVQPYVRHLPGALEHSICGLWYFTKHFVRVAVIILPVIWFIFNKPCKK